VNRVKSVSVRRNELLSDFLGGPVTAEPGDLSEPSQRRGGGDGRLRDRRVQSRPGRESPEEDRPAGGYLNF